MKPIRNFSLVAILIFGTISGAAVLARNTASTSAGSVTQTQQSQSPPTVASVVDRQVSSIEKLVVEAAEAMPDDKFNFSPESLNVPGSEYKGVRTFAVQVSTISFGRRLPATSCRTGSRTETVLRI